MSFKVTSDSALKTVNQYLENHFHPLALEQIRQINNDAFEAWLQKNGMPKALKRRILEYLKPLISRHCLHGILASRALRSHDKKVMSFTLIAVPSELKVEFRGSELILLCDHSTATEDEVEDSPPPLEFCSYMSCWVVNENNCSCVSTTSNANPCPADSCSSASDCCSGGGSSSKGAEDLIMQVISAF